MGKEKLVISGMTQKGQKIHELKIINVEWNFRMKYEV
jgi:hypothetical protein